MKSTDFNPMFSLFPDYWIKEQHGCKKKGARTGEKQQVKMDAEYWQLSSPLVPKQHIGHKSLSIPRYFSLFTDLGVSF